LLSDSANCTVLRAVVLTQYRRVTDGRTDGQTDGRNCRSLYSACNAARCKNSSSESHRLCRRLYLIDTNAPCTPPTIFPMCQRKPLTLLWEAWQTCHGRLVGRIVTDCSGVNALLSHRAIYFSLSRRGAVIQQVLHDQTVTRR